MTLGELYLRHKSKARARSVVRLMARIRRHQRYRELVWCTWRHDASVRSASAGAPGRTTGLRRQVRLVSTTRRCAAYAAGVWPSPSAGTTPITRKMSHESPGARSVLPDRANDRNRNIMSICYYLIRRDTRTVYALGKDSFLRLVFGETPTCVTADGVDTLVALILAAQRGDLDAEYDLSLHRCPDVMDETYASWRAVAVDVVDWSEGKSFEFHSEHSELFEEIMMEGWNHDPPRRRMFRTGDRFAATDDGSVENWSLAGRDVLAQRRRDDEAFRGGRVWEREALTPHG